MPEPMLELIHSVLEPVVGLYSLVLLPALVLWPLAIMARAGLPTAKTRRSRGWRRAVIAVELVLIDQIRIVVHRMASPEHPNTQHLNARGHSTPRHIRSGGTQLSSNCRYSTTSRVRSSLNGT